MKNEAFSKLLAFLERLEKVKISYSLEHSRDDAILVSLVVPGEYWEIEFLADGEIEIERYVSDGTIEDETALEEFFAKHSD
jgi:hypothetical protein